MPLQRPLLVIALIAAFWALAVAVGGGLEIGTIGLRSHRPWPALVIAGLAVGAAFTAGGVAGVRHALEGWGRTIDRRAATLAAIVAAATFAAGIVWGTFVAGGSDSSCYVSQAELLLEGRVTRELPLVAQVPWPDAVTTFVPAGYSRAARANAIAPTCPAGLSILMAGARLVGGPNARYLVVPALGSLAVWLTFVIGRTIGGGQTGVAAALLLAASPVFLYQVVQPMSDVPAMAWWALALAAAALDRRWSALVSGLACGFAIMTRPNLAPLAIVPAAALIVRDSRTDAATTRSGLRSRATVLLAFGAGCAPGVLVVALLQQAMFGSPFRTGYGQLDVLFAWDRIGPNLMRYAGWTLRTQTPSILLAAAAPFVVRGRPRRVASWLALFALGVIACYAAYVVFDDWWYVRFLLPAWPALMALTACTLVAAFRRLPLALSALALVVIVGTISVWYVGVAVRRNVFGLAQAESRFAHAGQYVAHRLPEGAVVLVGYQSGSVRHYSGRETLAWDMLDRAWLEGAIAHLDAIGRRPYLLLESWEEPRFRERFRASAIGQLDWPPIAQIGRDVRVYDPADRARYLAGASIRTEKIAIDRR